MGSNIWTLEEIELLKNMYVSSNIEDVDAAIPRHNRNSIYSKANKLKLRKPNYDSSKREGSLTPEQRERLVRSHTKWTKEQDELLILVYPTTKSEQLTPIFPGFTATQIVARAKLLGVKKDYAFFIGTGLEGSKAKWSRDAKHETVHKRGRNWGQARRSARFRSKYRCEWCEIPEPSTDSQLHVHHIIPFVEFGYVPGENTNYRKANRQSNLVALCASCHHVAETLEFDNRKDLLEFFKGNPRE